MASKRAYTPAGMQDRLPAETRRKRRAEAVLREHFARSGFAEVETPALEFYDTYAAGEGFARQEDLFKLTDDSGRLLVLRFDGTIPVARLVATADSHRDGILRYAYIAPVFRFRSHDGEARAFTQAGVELIGSAAAGADAEVIALAIRSAEALGIEAIHIAIGQTAYFRSLLEAWSPDARLAWDLPRLIDEKNEVAVRALIGSEAESFAPWGDLSGILLALLEDTGDWSVIDRLRRLTREPGALAALEQLAEVAKLLGSWGFLDRCSPDLGQLADMDYYSGISFAGYTYGTGGAILSGGRYDTVHGNFGRARPATGFSLQLDRCLEVQARNQPQPVDVAVRRLEVARGAEADVYATAERLRESGEAVAIAWPEK
ncbi:MAG: ATP phosphoribosyltransferase regulatory subunit [Bacillota bacterium]|nr:ATP phosphoribosyltransferase regulatory subunit [Bacillota bacterium]